MPEAATPQAGPPPKLRLMVSSTVYGLEGFLDQVFAILEGYGYEVWMSHKGTVPTNPKKTAFSHCLEAVNACDAFLGIITGSYGSGVGPNRRSITHRGPVERACNSRRRYGSGASSCGDRPATPEAVPLQRRRQEEAAQPFFKKTAVLEDIRVLEMYESASRHSLSLSRRAGNWVQEYSSHTDALRFIEAQFKEPARIRRFLEE